MEDYAKRSQKWEGEIEDAPSESTTAVPTWEATEIEATRKLDTWQPRLKPTTKDVARTLVRHRVDGTRIAEVSIAEIGRECGIRDRQVREHLRRLRHARVIAEPKQQGGGHFQRYPLSPFLVPEYVLDAPQLKKQPPRGLLIRNEPITFRSAENCRAEGVGSAENCRAEAVGSAENCRTDRPHKENAYAPARDGGGGGSENGSDENSKLLFPPPPPDEVDVIFEGFSRLVHLLKPEGEQPSYWNAERLLANLRVKALDITAPEAVLLLLEKAKTTNPKKPPETPIGFFLNWSMEQFCTKDLKRLRAEQRRAREAEREEQERRESEAKREEQERPERLRREAEIYEAAERRKREAEEREAAARDEGEAEERKAAARARDEAEAARDAFSRLPAEEQSALREKAKSSILEQQPIAHSWPARRLEELIDDTTWKQWFRRWQFRMAIGKAEDHC